ncbi:RimJ/RimL family protein N-acetyltransferase [Bradyrhizobium ottawaense]|nr:GNAT family N-acetyltransferase [Bradyrhizobium ottawaense]
MPTPQLETERLILRPLALSDVPAIQRHFDNWNIIRHLSMVVPWPYPADGAETFVRMQFDKISAGDDIHLWVLVLKEGDGEAIGNIHLRPRAEGPKGNRGFWLAEPYWRRGQRRDQRSLASGQAEDRRGIRRLHRARPSRRAIEVREMDRAAGGLVGQQICD